MLHRLCRVLGPLKVQNGFWKAKLIIAGDNTVTTRFYTMEDTVDLPIEACVLHGAKDLRLESRSIDAPAPTEVQVEVKATGLCGSDLHYYNHGRNGDIIMREPLALGHESAGVVVSVGSSVTALNSGDRVALEVGVPCSACDRCSEGRYNICKDMRFRSSAKSFPHFQGTLQTRINHPASFCHKLPEDVSLELGALLEPLSVALHAVRRAQMKLKSNVLIFGAGAVGLLTAGVAKLSGAARVVIADIDKGRLDFALKHRFADASHCVPLTRGQTVEENLEIAKANVAALYSSVDDYKEADVTYECTGVPLCVYSSIFATRPGGRVLLIGMGTPVYAMPVSAAALREVDIVGVFRYANTYPEGIRLVSDAIRSKTGPDFAALVTHRYTGLESAAEAFDMAARTQDGAGKVVLKVVIASGRPA